METYINTGGITITTETSDVVIEVIFNSTVVQGTGSFHIERGIFTLVADEEQTIEFDTVYANTNYSLFVNTISAELGKNLIYNDYPQKAVDGFKIKAIGDAECEYFAIY